MSAIGETPTCAEFFVCQEHYEYVNSHRNVEKTFTLK